MTHLHYRTRRPGELTSPVLRPRVTAPYDLTTIQVWKENARDCLSHRRLKDTASFLQFLCTGQSKCVALHFEKIKLYWEPGTALFFSFTRSSNLENRQELPPPVPIHTHTNTWTHKRRTEAILLLIFKHFNEKSWRPAAAWLAFLNKEAFPWAGRREDAECFTDERWGILKTILNNPD